MSNASKQVLIVEDDPDIVLALTTILEDAGYVAAVSNGADLKRLIHDDPPDLLLLDMLLSGWDGREIARWLKVQEAAHHIPILMLSAHPTAEQEAKAAGADDFLAKPFELDALLAKVAALLR